MSSAPLTNTTLKKGASTASLIVTRQADGGIKFTHPTYGRSVVIHSCPQLTELVKLLDSLV